MSETLVMNMITVFIIVEGLIAIVFLARFYLELPMILNKRAELKTTKVSYDFLATQYRKQGFTITNLNCEIKKLKDYNKKLAERQFEFANDSELPLLREAYKTFLSNNGFGRIEGKEKEHLVKLMDALTSYLTRHK